MTILILVVVNGLLSGALWHARRLHRRALLRVDELALGWDAASAPPRVPEAFEYAAAAEAAQTVHETCLPRRAHAKDGVEFDRIVAAERDVAARQLAAYMRETASRAAYRKAIGR